MIPPGMRAVLRRRFDGDHPARVIVILDRQWRTKHPDYLKVSAALDAPLLQVFPEQFYARDYDFSGLAGLAVELLCYDPGCVQWDLMNVGRELAEIAAPIWLWSRWLTMSCTATARCDVLDASLAMVAAHGPEWDWIDDSYLARAYRWGRWADRVGVAA